MREYMAKLLQEAFGPPARSREHCDWWEIVQDGHPHVHVCLNAPTRPLVAHVLIFNPARRDETLVDLSAQTEEEAEGILLRIRAMVTHHVSNADAKRS